MSNIVHQALLRQAVEAARSGDRLTARARVDEVLAEDAKNVRAWLLLARLTDDAAEKRRALDTVLELDAYNEQALAMLNRLEELNKEKAVAKEEIAPGISRRQLTFIGLGVVGFVAVIMIVVGLFVAGNSRSRTNQQGTQAAMNSTGTAFINQQTAAAIEQTEQATAAAATLTQMVAVPPTSRGVRPTLPPTATPTPAPTSTPALALPTTLTGRIIGWSGNDIQNIDVLPMLSWDVATGSAQPLGIVDGRYPHLYDNGQRLIYTRYFVNPSTFYTLESNLLDGSDPQNITAGWALVDPFNDPDEASVSPDGTKIVFVAETVATGAREVYLVDLTQLPAAPDPTAAVALPGGAGTLPPNTVLRITNDAGNFSFPSMSADGSRIVAILDRVEGDVRGPDVVLINLADRSITPLTNDGDEVVETHPRLSNDSQRVVYAGAPGTARSSHDIYIVAADGAGEPFALVSEPADEIYPVYSPDNGSLAFASNRSGRYNIYVYTFTGQSLAQVTFTDQDDDYPSVWVP